MHYIIALRNNSLPENNFKRTNQHHSAFLKELNVKLFYYWRYTTKLLEVTYTVLTNFLIYVETAIPTWRYSSTYPKDIIANYV